MKQHIIIHRDTSNPVWLSVFAWVLWFALSGQVWAAPRAVPTFHCMSLYWITPGASSTEPCAVRYRKLSEPAQFRNAQDLFYDVTNSRYSGSVVNLQPGTVYVFELKKGTTVETVTAATWTENFPIKNTIALPSVVPATYVITTGGSAAEGYVLYDGTPNATVIDADPAGGDETDAANYCVEIKASYVILRGVVAKNAKIHGIYLNADVRDVVIEGCDISNWGRKNAWAGKTVKMRAPNFENGRSFGTAPLVTSTETKVVLPNLGKQLDCGIAGKGNNIERIIIQGNKIHHPRYTSNDWCQPSGDYFAYDVANSIAGFHPEGPKAVVLYQPGVDKPTKANHVIRYNNIYGDSSHRFNDILFESFGGAMKAIDCLFDTDVYGNYMADVVDDILEVERAVCNNRVFENYFTNVGGKAISYYQDKPLGGPFYQFRNVFDAVHNANRPGFWYSVQSPNTRANLMRRPFLPTGAHLVPEPTGRLYSYHNIYLAPDDQGFLFFQGNDVPLTPGPFEGSLVSRNNIYKSSALWPTTSGPGLPAVTAPMMTYNSGPSLPGVKTFDGDVYNGSVEAVAAGAFGSQCQQGVAIFEVGHGIGNSGKYQLALASPGHDRGLILPNFNDGYEGAAPDSGIQERGAPDLVFGVARFTPASGPPPQGFTPTADARVRSDLPTVNDGNSANLTVQKSATRQFESYLRFSVTGLSGRVIAAKLILKESPDGTSNSTNSALEVRSISGAWGEADVTWNNKPAYAAIALGSVPANSITQDQIVEILLDPSHFSGDGTYNLAMIGTSDGNDVPLFSREATTAANRPQLILLTRQLNK